jgi:hypothetical protein
VKDDVVNKYGDAARIVVESPSASAHDLTSIAQKRPDLWPLIAAHPNAYPSLLAFLVEKGDDEVIEAVRSRPDKDEQDNPSSSPRRISGARRYGRYALLEDHDLDEDEQAEPPVTSRGLRIPRGVAIKKKTIVITSVVSAVVLVTIALVSLLIVQPHRSLAHAQEDFAQAQTGYISAQESLYLSLADAADVLDKTTVEQIDDPVLLDNLATNIEAAKELIAPVPDMAESAPDIRGQASAMNDATVEVRLMVESLDSTARDINTMVATGVDVTGLKLGDCLIIRNLEGRIHAVPRVGCQAPHDAEIILVTTAPDGEFSQSGLNTFANAQCTQAMIDYVGPRHGFVSSRGLGLTFFAPSENSWENGDRTITCLAYAKSERSELTSSIQGKGK